MRHTTLFPCKYSAAFEANGHLIHRYKHRIINTDVKRSFSCERIESVVEGWSAESKAKKKSKEKWREEGKNNFQFIYEMLSTTHTWKDKRARTHPRPLHIYVIRMHVTKSHTSSATDLTHTHTRTPPAFQSEAEVSHIRGTIGSTNTTIAEIDCECANTLTSIHGRISYAWRQTYERDHWAWPPIGTQRSTKFHRLLKEMGCLSLNNWLWS